MRQTWDGGTHQTHLHQRRDAISLLKALRVLGALTAPTLLAMIRMIIVLIALPKFEMYEISRTLHVAGYANSMSWPEASRMK